MTYVSISYTNISPPFGSLTMHHHWHNNPCCMPAHIHYMPNFSFMPAFNNFYPNYYNNIFAPIASGFSAILGNQNFNVSINYNSSPWLGGVSGFTPNWFNFDNNYNSIGFPNFNFDWSSVKFNMPTYTPSISYKSEKHNKTGNIEKNNKISKRGKYENGARDFGTMWRDEALIAAKNSKFLENIESGGKGWTLHHESFTTDIPYARKGTKAILDKVYEQTGIRMRITSALGTKGRNNSIRSPHSGAGDYLTSSHFYEANPKIDICAVDGNNKRLAEKLNATGLFDRVSLESDHIDVRIKDGAYSQFSVTA